MPKWERVQLPDGNKTRPGLRRGLFVVEKEPHAQELAWVLSIDEGQFPVEHVYCRTQGQAKSFVDAIYDVMGKK